MTKRVEFKPQKGWKYRIIVCNENGKVVWDDFNDPRMLMEGARRMIKEVV